MPDTDVIEFAHTPRHLLYWPRGRAGRSSVIRHALAIGPVILRRRIDTVSPEVLSSALPCWKPRFACLLPSNLRRRQLKSVQPWSMKSVRKVGKSRFNPLDPFEALITPLSRLTGHRIGLYSTASGSVGPGACNVEAEPDPPAGADVHRRSVSSVGGWMQTPPANRAAGLGHGLRQHKLAILLHCQNVSMSRRYSVALLGFGRYPCQVYLTLQSDTPSTVLLLYGYTMPIILSAQLP